MIENSNELIFETLNEKRYAPSAQVFGNSLYDSELERELKRIPDKLAFKIGEVADIAEVKPYVLRYWETEFEQLRPQKSQKGQRVYLKRDVELVLMVRKLLYRDRFSIEGARVALRRLKKDSRQIKAAGGTVDELDQIKTQVEDLSLHLSSLKDMFR
jgi:DNA-binding transcriptional MerR regulator